MQNKDEKQGNPLWEFSLKAYGKDQLAQNCLILQDEYALDVNLILLFVWTGLSGAKLTDESTETLIRHAKAWCETTIEPLRTIRRTLKNDIGAVTQMMSADFREDIKAIELAAEKIQQDMLMNVLVKLTAVNALEGDRKSVARRNLLTYLQIQQIKVDTQIRESFESILTISEQVFLSLQLAENENEEA
ncbi:TIGR02444 family protein [Curvivirga aplysinae]|uniref:TIGR02444 family protein n=1 Tax=Curvivirga aplysinae TaxID=2529852 RepID=UPI0012BCA060|nr:TIGR02444 family protein [Curvivirga aplysinae]MTI08236.1 TIGR02444 family protein [Curvivirga aplysinae]